MCARMVFIMLRTLIARQVQHIFGMYKTGKFIPGKAFSAANVSYLTESWYRKSVSRYARNQDKFSKLARKASKYASARYQTRTRTGDAQQAPDLFDRSSPPLEDTDAEMDDNEPYCEHIHVCSMPLILMTCLVDSE